MPIQNDHSSARIHADFEEIYLNHYAALHRYAYTILEEDTLAEEMVHQVFWKILESGGPARIETSLKAYLYRAVHNECLSYIKHQKVRKTFEQHVMTTMKDQIENTPQKLQQQELEKRLRIAINKLPEQCRTIFQLSRFEGMKYAEIATRMGLSVKSVETQMSRALRKLRIQLADYLPYVVWLLFNLFR